MEIVGQASFVPSQGDTDGCEALPRDGAAFIPDGG